MPNDTFSPQTTERKPLPAEHQTWWPLHFPDAIYCTLDLTSAVLAGFDDPYVASCNHDDVSVIRVRENTLDCRKVTRPEICDPGFGSSGLEFDDKSLSAGPTPVFRKRSRWRAIRWQPGQDSKSVLLLLFRSGHVRIVDHGFGLGQMRNEPFGKQVGRAGTALETYISS